MSDAPNKAATRLIKWRDSARRQLSTASCCEDLASALQFVLRNAGKTLRAVLRSPDDDRLSRDLNDVLCHVSSHLYLRSRSLLADRIGDRFDYWAHQCAVLSYLLDLSLIRDEPGTLTKICFVLSKNKHAVWDVLVQTSAVASATEPQSKLVDLFRRLAAYCPRTCTSAALYFKFVVCAACLARRLPERGWKTVKPVVLSIEPAEFDFEQWFSSQSALVALLPRSEVPTCRRKVIARLCKSASDPAELLEACRTLEECGGGIRTTCEAAAASEEDMFLIADEEVQEPEQDARTAEVEDEQLHAILDATLSRLQLNIATPRKSDVESNSEFISEVSNSPLNTRAFLDRLLCNSAGDTGDEVLKNAESPTKKLGSGRQELDKGANNSAENEDAVATRPKDYEHASGAEEVSEGEDRAGNCADETTAASRRRKNRKKRKKARKARALRKRGGTGEMNDKLTALKTPKESAASEVSLHKEVQQKTCVSSQGNALHHHAHGQRSISVAQNSDSLAMLSGNRHGMQKTKQGGVNKPQEKSCKHIDAKVDDEAMLSSIKGPPCPSSSQDEPVGISVKKTLSQCYKTSKATLLVDAGDPISSPESTTGSILPQDLPSPQLYMCPELSSSMDFSTLDSSTGKSCSEQESSSYSDVQDHDDHSDHEEMLPEHCDPKTSAKTLSTKGRRKNSGQIDDSAEALSSSSGDEAVAKTSRQAMSGDTAEPFSSVSDAEVVAENGGRDLPEDAAVTLSKLNLESSGQHLSHTPFEVEDVAVVSTVKKAHGSQIVSSESTGQERRAKLWALEAEPARAVRKARSSRIFISSGSSDEDHSAQHLPLKKAEPAVEEGLVEDLEQVESSDKEDIVERSASQEVKSSEKHRVEHSTQQDYNRARTVKNARRSRTSISSKSSDEDHSVEPSPLHKAESSDEEGIVGHSAQKAEFSDQNSSSEHTAPRKAKSFKKRCIEQSARRKLKPGRTVKGARRRRPLISSESSSDEEGGVRKSAPKEPRSAEKHFVERSEQGEDCLVRTLLQPSSSRTLISSESSGDDHCVDYSPLQKAQSSDGEGSTEHSALRQVKPAKTVRKACRSKTVIPSESSDEDHCAEQSLQRKPESSNKENGAKRSEPQQAELPDRANALRHPVQRTKSCDVCVSAKHSATQECSHQNSSAEDSALQKADSSDGEGRVDHPAPQDAELSDKCSVEHPTLPDTVQCAQFSDFADEIPCGQQSPDASSLLNMHLSPPESPVTEANHLAAESDADTLELQSNDVGLASCWQRAARLSQATTVSVSSQRRSPSPFSKLKEMVLSFEDDSDDETDPVDFRRKTLSSALPQSSFKVPLVKKSTSVRKSVKSKGQGGRRSLDERNGPGKSQPARRKGCSRGSPSLLVKQRVVSDKEQVSMSDSDCADAATSDVASASFNADGTRLMNVSAAKTEDLSPSKKKASTRRDSPRTSLPTNKTSKLPEANETSESERNGASRLDSDEFQRDENEPLEAEKDTRKSPKMEKMMAGRTPFVYRRKDTPRPQPLTSNLALCGKEALKLSLSQKSDGTSVSVNEESVNSEHSRQNIVDARQPLGSAVSTRRQSTRSCARSLVFAEQEVCEFSVDASRDVNAQTVQSRSVATSLSMGVQRQDYSNNANLTPEKSCAPAKLRSSGRLSRRLESPTKQGSSSDNGIAQKSPAKEATLSVIKQKSGIEVANVSTISTRQMASGSGHSSSSTMRGESPASGINEAGQTKHGVLTRSARRQLSLAMDNTSPLKEGRTTLQSRVVGPDVQSGGKPGTNEAKKSGLREGIESPPLKVRRKVLQDSVNNGDSVRCLSPTQDEEAITEKECGSGNKGEGSPFVTVRRLQSNETESAATHRGNQSMPRTRSVSASLPSRKEVQATSTGCDVSHSSKQQLEESITARVAGSCRSPSRTPPKRRGVGEASANVTPGPETAEHDLSETNDNLGGLTQVPLLRNVDALPNSLSSDKEGDLVQAAMRRMQSLRRVPSRRCSQHNTKEDSIIDFDTAVLSFSDSDDDDSAYEAPSANFDASIAHLRKLKVPLYESQERQSRPPSAASSYKVVNTSTGKTSRLSLTAIRASQSDNSASTQSPPFSPVPTTSSEIVDTQSPTSNFCTCQSPSRHTRTYDCGLIDAAMEKQAGNTQSVSDSNVDAPSVSEHPQALMQTAMSVETPVMRRSTRVRVKRDTPARTTRTSCSMNEKPAAAMHSSHLKKDLDVVTEEQTLLATKRNKNSRMSFSLKTQVELSDERSSAAEQESATDKASSAVCSTCRRSVNAPSTQDSGTMTDDSFLHDEDAFSNSPRYSKRRKTGGHNASASQPKAVASRSSSRHGAASQEASVPTRRSLRLTTRMSRRLSYT